MSPLPLGFEAVARCMGGQRLSKSVYKASVIIITFLTYAAYHAARKPPSVVKSTLFGNQNTATSASASASTSTRPARSLLSLTRELRGVEMMAGVDHLPTSSSSGSVWAGPTSSLPYDVADGTAARQLQEGGSFTSSSSSGGDGKGWAPFNDPKNGKRRLGQIDLAFLLTYAVGMFFAGHIGDNMNLRHFLTIGMIGTCVFTVAFGAGQLYDVHNLWFYVGMQILAGLFQSTGWPSVVSVMGSWYGKGKRGLIMGIWNAHTSVGNISGTIVAAAALQYGWGWSFILPGLAMGAVGLLVALFLIPEPSDAGHHALYQGHSVASDLGDIRTKQDLRRRVAADQLEVERATHGTHGVGFAQALAIPGVVTFALCLFFCKLIAYTFLYWLPYYIRETEIGGRGLTAKEAGDLSVLFDIGGILGGVAAGHLSDRLGASSVVSTVFVYLSIPVLYAYRHLGHISFFLNVSLMMVAGFFVNGPYALITTAVSADLGTHDSLKGSEKALATVTAIIDGMGSVGAAVGPLATGIISELPGGFTNVFRMLYAAALIAGLLLTKLFVKEVKVLYAAWASGDGTHIGSESEDGEAVVVSAARRGSAAPRHGGGGRGGRTLAIDDADDEEALLQAGGTGEAGGSEAVVSLTTTAHGWGPRPTSRSRR